MFCHHQINLSHSLVCMFFVVCPRRPHERSASNIYNLGWVWTEWVCQGWVTETAAVWGRDKSDAYSQGRSALRWSHTDCMARCPESHVAPCRTHRSVLLMSQWTAVFFQEVKWLQTAAVVRLPLPRRFLWTLSGRLLVLFLLWTRVPVLSWTFLLFLQNLQRKKTQIHSQVTAQLLLHKYHRSILQQRRVRYLFEVSKLDELYGHLGVLQLYGFAHSGLGVCRGQTDQSLERTGRHGWGLRRERRKKMVRWS